MSVVCHRRKDVQMFKDHNDSEKESLLRSAGSPSANGSAVIYGNSVTQSVNA